MSRHAFDTYLAANDEEVRATWYDYIRYLDAQLARLDADALDNDDDVLEAPSGQNDGGDALARIPQRRRAVFDRVLEGRRQRAQAEADDERRRVGGRTDADPLLIERTAVQQLRDEALGKAPGQDGLGKVPLDGENNWVEVPVDELLAAPKASAYSLRGLSGDDRNRSVLQIAGVVVVAVLLLLGYYLWPRSTPPAVVDVELQPAVNATPVTPWTISVVAVQVPTETVALELAPWADAPDPVDALVARWRRPSLLPLHVCVPSALHNAAQRLELRGRPSEPVRSYQIGDDEGNAPDLILAACDTPDTPPRYGLFEASALPPDLAVDQGTLLGTTPFTVTAIRSVGPGEDTEVSTGTMRLEVEVDTGGVDVRWSEWSPTVLLLDGEQRGQSASAEASVEPATDGAAPRALLHYQVPFNWQPLSVVWQVTSPDGTHGARWRHTAPPPPSRDSVLRSRLAVVPLPPTGDDETITLELTLTNRSDEPLLLVESDFQLLRDGNSEQLPVLPDLSEPLKKREARRLSLDIPRTTVAQPTSGDVETPLVLVIGPYRFELEWSKEVVDSAP